MILKRSAWNEVEMNTWAYDRNFLLVSVKINECKNFLIANGSVKFNFATKFV